MADWLRHTQEWASRISKPKYYPQRLRRRIEFVTLFRRASAYRYSRIQAVVSDPFRLRRPWKRRQTLEANVKAKQIFVNLPVKDLKCSVEFFTRLGYTFNPQFTDENATGMIVDDNIFVMLLVESFFKTFMTKTIADARVSTEVILSFSVESRDAVDATIRKAVAAGAPTPVEPKDFGFMYQHGFQDLHGHLWEFVYMNPNQMPS